MTRYWKLITITTIIVLTIGTFYISSAMAGNNYPEFVFDKQSGNEDEVANLTLFGDYGAGLRGNPVEISSKGTIYANDLSFFERLNGIYMDSEMERLQKDYRNFMRGKDNIWSLFEDQKRLAYVDINDNYVVDGPREFIFNIEILEKDPGKILDFTITIPEKKKYNQVYIEDVQVLDNVMKVITKNHLVDGNERGSEEVHVYSIDIANKKLVNDEVIQLNTEESSNQNAYIYTLQNHSDIGTATYIVFQKEQMEEVVDEYGNYYEEPKVNELIAYHFATGEQQTIQLPKEINMGNGFVSVEGSTIYIYENKNQVLKIAMFNMDSQEMEDNKTIKLPTKLNEPSNTKIKDGKLYVVGYEANKNTKAPLLVFDINSGKILYDGILEAKNLTENQLEHRLYIHDMEFK